MDFAEKDWVTAITEGSNAFVLTRIESIKSHAPLTPQESGGILTVRLVRALGEPIAELSDFEVSYFHFTEGHRRIKSGNQGWNGVEIQPLTLLVLAAPKESFPSGNAVEPVSVASVAGEDDPLVRGLSDALAIESEPKQDNKKRMLARALWSDLPVLGTYAQDAVGRLKRIPRDQAIELDCALVSDASASMNRRLAAVSTLEKALWKNGAPDDAGNKKILTALFVLLKDPRAEALQFLVPVLYRLVAAQDAGGYRAKLLSGVARPGPDEIRKVQWMASDPNLGQESLALVKALTEP